MDDQHNQPTDDSERTLHIPRRQFVASEQPTPQQGQQQAAAHVVREQINHIYNTQSPNQPKRVEPIAEQANNPYNHTHQEAFDWRKYHTAWQQYYQQYYQRYYWQQLHSERQKLAAAAADQAVQQETGIIAGEDPNAPAKTKVAALRADVTGRVKERAKKVRRSRHFIPLVSAAGVGLVFLFLQFNSVVFAQIQSYISPGAISSDAITVDPNANINVGPDPKLIIPKINVDVPVDYTINNLSETQIQDSLRDGATHYALPGANAVPGQKGNTVILGHSSNDIFNQGKYKFVFVLLDRVQAGDLFYLHYNGTRYIYRVTSTKVIDPTDVSALQVGTDKPMATLVTCTPPGTALKRLLIFGEQISPDPSGVTQTASPTTTQSKSTSIPGNGPTILDQIWNFFF